MENNQNELGKLSAPFRALIGNEGLNYQLLDLLPIPIEIFTPDGTSIFSNRAYLELFNIPDVNSLVGQYNLKHDPVCLGIMGQEFMDKIFNGEACSFPGFPVPLDDAVNRGIIKEKPFEAATADIFSLPLWDGETFICTICFFTVKRTYVKVKQYIDEHWLDEYDDKAIAKAINISPSHLYALFRSNTGMTMYDYYKKVKVEHIKEKLKDEKLSIAEAFSFCGEDNRGAFVRTFKEYTGMTPTEYRNSMK
jgi:AraC-like DNA-binding protein